MTAPRSESRYARTPSGRSFSYQVFGSGMPVVLMPLPLAIPNMALREEWAHQSLPATVKLVTYSHLGRGRSDRRRAFLALSACSRPQTWNGLEEYYTLV